MCVWWGFFGDVFILCILFFVFVDIVVVVSFDDAITVAIVCVHTLYAFLHNVFTRYMRSCTVGQCIHLPILFVVTIATSMFDDAITVAIVCVHTLYAFLHNVFTRYMRSCTVGQCIIHLPILLLSLLPLQCIRITPLSPAAKNYVCTYFRALPKNKFCTCFKDGPSFPCRHSATVSSTWYWRHWTTVSWELGIEQLWVGS